MHAPTPSLLAAFAAGDANAYSVLFERYRARLTEFVRARIDPALARDLTAEDVVQETHARALAKVADFEYTRELSFFFWLCAIARNQVRMAYRSRNRKPPEIARMRPGAGLTSQDVVALVAADVRSPASQVGLRQSLELLASGLEQIDPRRRRALILRYIEELPGKVAAERMGVSHGAFRVLVARGLADLRRALADISGEAA